MVVVKSGFGRFDEMGIAALHPSYASCANLPQAVECPEQRECAGRDHERQRQPQRGCLVSVYVVEDLLHGPLLA